MIKILIVEDEKPISDLIKMSLLGEGYHCTCAYDGQAAADIIENDVFDLVLLDVMLPTAVQKWLMKNSWKYGFILRYPSDKSHITGIYYEPWHYRYVGKEAAKEIYEKGICFEEYLGELNNG